MRRRGAFIGSCVVIALAPGALCVWLGLWAWELARQEAGRRWVEARMAREQALMLFTWHVCYEPEIGLTEPDPDRVARAVKCYQEDVGAGRAWEILWYLTRHWLREMSGDPRLAFVEKLRFPMESGEMSDADWAFYIGSFPRVRHVGLLEAPIHDEQLRHLAKLRQLESLSLSGTPIHGEGLRYLANLPKLKDLDLTDVSLSPAGKQALGRLTRLEVLRVVGDDGVAEQVTKLTKLRNLQLLLFGGPGPRPGGLTDKGLVRIARLPSLYTLDVESDQISDEGLRVLSRTPELSGLRHLGVFGERISDTGVRYVANAELGRGLYGLFLGSPRLSDVALWEIGRLRQLSQLMVRGKGITDAGLSHLQYMEKLWSLHLSETSVTGTGFGTLQWLNALQELVLIGSPVTDAGVAQIAGFSDLARLSLRHTRVTGTGFNNRPGAFGRLTWLDLAYTPVSDEGLKALAGLTELRELDLEGTLISDAGLECLADLRHLERLRLCRTRITGEKMNRWGELTALRELNLTGTRFTDEGLRRLRGVRNPLLVRLYGTKVTQKAIQEVQRSAPDIVILADESEKP